MKNRSVSGPYQSSVQYYITGLKGGKVQPKTILIFFSKSNPEMLKIKGWREKGRVNTNLYSRLDDSPESWKRTEPGAGKTAWLRTVRDGSTETTVTSSLK